MRVTARTLAGTSAAAVVTAAAGAAASSRGADSPWYAALRKPAFQPPPAAFPVVWTALYADVALSSAVVLDGLEQQGDDEAATAYRRALAANLVLNGAWTWVFFRFHRLGAATVVAGALTVSGGDLVRRARRASPPAAAALGPYAAWCAFATVLSAAIRRRNR